MTLVINGCWQVVIFRVRLAGLRRSLARVVRRDGYVGAGSHGGTLSLVPAVTAGRSRWCRQSRRDVLVGTGCSRDVFVGSGPSRQGTTRYKPPRVRSRRPFGSGCTARSSILGTRTRPVRGALGKLGGMTLILTPILTPTVDPAPGARGGPAIPRPTCGPGRGPRPGCRRGFSAQPSHVGHPRTTLLRNHVRHAGESRGFSANPSPSPKTAPVLPTYPGAGATAQRPDSDARSAEVLLVLPSPRKALANHVRITPYMTNETVPSWVGRAMWPYRGTLSLGDTPYTTNETVPRWPGTNVTVPR